MKSAHYIHDYLRQQHPTNFISASALPHKSWSDGGLPRIQHHFVHVHDKAKIEIIPLKKIKLYEGGWRFILRHHPVKLAWKVIQAVCLFPLRRQHPRYLRPFGGEVWWALTNSTVSYILHYIKQHPDFVKFHTTSLFPKELFFHSLVYSRVHDLSGPITNSTLHYIDWSKLQGLGSAVFTMEDQAVLKDKMMQPDVLFARKFDATQDKAILDYIDSTVVSSPSK